MAAVSLSEAWNDTALKDETPPPSPPPKRQTMVAARRSAPKKLAPPVDDESDAEIEHVAPPEETPPIVIEAPPPQPIPPPQVSYQGLLLQLELLRKEESRRCTIYIAIGGILFAILFVYIDRLNQQVRMLNTFLLHRHMPTLAAVSGQGPFHTLT